MYNNVRIAYYHFVVWKRKGGPLSIDTVEPVNFLFLSGSNGLNLGRDKIFSNDYLILIRMRDKKEIFQIYSTYVY